MHKFLLCAVIVLNSIRCFPHLILYLIHRNRNVIQADIRRWLSMMNKSYKLPIGFIYLMTFYTQFRNIFYYRIGSDNIFLNVLCARMSTLTISTGKIGEGLYIPHGFSTTIGATSIGKNCSINHNVTIGTYGEKPRPVILDNVVINAGAAIFGNITIGNNVIIGANATVNMNIPDNCTVFPPPSRIMKWNKSNCYSDSIPENSQDNKIFPQ